MQSIDRAAPWLRSAPVDSRSGPHLAFNWGRCRSRRRPASSAPAWKACSDSIGCGPTTRTTAPRIVGSPAWRIGRRCESESVSAAFLLDFEQVRYHRFAAARPIEKRVARPHARQLLTCCRRSACHRPTQRRHDGCWQPSSRWRSGCRRLAPRRRPSRSAAAAPRFPIRSTPRGSRNTSRSKPDVRIAYQSIGSGAGIRQLTDQFVFFGATDTPMTEDELLAAPRRIVHLPTVVGAVVPIYNIPGVSSELKFSGPVLADIFLGKITNWNDLADRAG